MFFQGKTLAVAENLCLLIKYYATRKFIETAKIKTN